MFVITFKTDVILYILIKWETEVPYFPLDIVYLL